MSGLSVLEERFTLGALRLLNTLVSKIGCEIPLLIAGRNKTGLRTENIECGSGPVNGGKKIEGEKMGRWEGGSCNERTFGP